MSSQVGLGGLVNKNGLNLDHSNRFCSPPTPAQRRECPLTGAWSEDCPLHPPPIHENSKLQKKYKSMKFLNHKRE